MGCVSGRRGSGAVRMELLWASIRFLPQRSFDGALSQGGSLCWRLCEGWSQQDPPLVGTFLVSFLVLPHGWA